MNACVCTYVPRPGQVVKLSAPTWTSCKTVAWLCRARSAAPTKRLEPEIFPNLEKISLLGRLTHISVLKLNFAYIHSAGTGGRKRAIPKGYIPNFLMTNACAHHSPLVCLFAAGFYYFGCCFVWFAITELLARSKHCLHPKYFLFL